MRLLLEGPDLQTLLEEVRTEYGAGARIVQAEKVRRGGVGGFFARERFNLQVEVAEVHETSQPAAGRGDSAVQCVMDLVDRLNREEEALHQDVIDAPQPAAPLRAPASPAVASAYATTAQPAAPPSSPQVTVRPQSAPSTPVSTQSASFTDVMSRLQQGIDSRALAPTSASRGPGTPVRADASQPTEPAQATSQSAPALHRAPARRPLFTGAQMAARATRMGVPAYVLAGVEDPADVYRRLLAWVESRPTAPLITSTPGQVIAVVGELTAAMRVATVLARELRVDPTAIHLAVPASSTGHTVPVGRLLSDVSDMAIRRERWRQSVGSTIVVVEAALPPAAQGWLAAVVSALAPTFTWAVAQASTKVNDVVSWASLVGEVDALALVNLPATGDPAAALAGPLPVGLLDSQHATVTRWMSMLTDEGDHR